MPNSTFHPDLRRIAAVLPRGLVGPRRLAVLRALQRLGQPNRVRQGIEVVPVGPISLRLHRPSPAPASPAPAILWIHGGGYVMGNAAQDDGICRHLASALGALVAAVDYRLAPEHPFPVPLHDCHEALVWLASRDDVDGGRIAIAGASAGGGLTAALTLLARERDQVRPVFQLLTYPMLDDRTTARPSANERDLRLWNTPANRFGWRSYLGTEPGGDGVSELAAPARAENLSGLPPAWIGVGSLDLFAAEDTVYADRLRAAGVPCDLLLVDGAFHGFDLVSAKAPVSRSFRAAQVDALARAFADPHP
jgi:acetyl esterase/lipase